MKSSVEPSSCAPGFRGLPVRCDFLPSASFSPTQQPISGQQRLLYPLSFLNSWKLPLTALLLYFTWNRIILSCGNRWIYLVILNVPCAITHILLLIVCLTITFNTYIAGCLLQIIKWGKIKSLFVECGILKRSKINYLNKEDFLSALKK